MDIYGNTLSAFDLLLLSSAGALALAFLQFRGPLTQASIQRHAEACSVFRNAFADALLNLEHPEIRAAEVVRLFHLSHTQAIREFRHHIVGWLRKRNFDKACREYKQCAAPYLQMGIVGQFQSETLLHMQAMRAALKASIECLVSYAKET